MKQLHEWSTDSIQHALERALTSVDPRLCPNLTGIEERRGPWFTEYQGRELDFIRDILGQRTYKGAISLWEAERYIVEALFEHRFVSVFSARGTGKTFTAGVLVPTFFYTAPSRVVTISRTGAQIKEQVWAEINKVVRTNERLPGRKLTTKLEISPNNPKCVALGMCARDPDAVRGYHASPVMGGDPDADDLTAEDLEHVLDDSDDSIRLLLIVDEAQGIPEEVYRSLAGMFNKPNTYCLLIGNPTLGLDDDVEYVRSLTHPSSHYHTVKISAFPETQFPDDTRYDKVFDRVPRKLIDEPTLERVLKVYDDQDPVFLADWLGQFSPGSTSAQVVTRAILEGAPGVWQDRAIGPRIGLDIGTGKPDPCVATLAVNGKVVAVHEWRPAADDDAGQVSIVDEVVALCTKWGRQVRDVYGEKVWDGRALFGSERLSIDDSGLVGVGDILASRGVDSDRVNFASRADGHWFEYTKPERFANVRAEMHWVARRGLQEGLFCVPDDDRFRRTRQQAQWTHYFRDDDKRGPILKLEPKEKVIARHGRSPDHWDSAVLAFREARQAFTMGSFGAPHQSVDGVYAGRNGRRGRRRRPGWTRIQG